MRISSLWRRLPARRTTDPVGASVPLPAVSASTLSAETSRDHRPTITAAHALPDGTACDPPLLAAIDREMAWRRTSTGTLDGPELPRFTNLAVRHAGLPDWWHDNGNLLLCGTDTQVEIVIGFRQIPCRDCLAVIGSNVVPPRIAFEGEDGLVALGDGCAANSSSFNIHGDSSIMIGENTTATFMAMIDVRNGGIVAVGDDNMWAIGVSLMSDDTHAIRDAVTDARINTFGGKIVIERHVWLGNNVNLMGHCHVGHDSVIGQGSFVKNVTVPPQTVAAGRPARPLRKGVTWNRQDLP